MNLLIIYNPKAAHGDRFKKASGKRSRKIFKITENEYSTGVYNFSKKHSFADMSTRKHVAGKHGIALIVNGEEKARVELNLVSQNMS